MAEKKKAKKEEVNNFTMLDLAAADRIREDNHILGGEQIMD